MENDMNAASVVQELTWEEKVAQLLMPSLHPGRFFADEEYKDHCFELVRGGVGGFCVFQGTLEEAERAVIELQAAADVPLIFSADFEHGLPMRLEGGTDFPHAMAITKAHDITLTEKIARSIAKEMKAIGIHWNFAPVCDVNSNKENPIINTRSFGESVGEVVPQIVSWIGATQSEKIVACAKHFPGHGDTNVDSHIQLPTLLHSIENLEAVEIPPFASAIQSGVLSVMVGHLSVPSLDPSGLPSSFSESVVGVLRKQLQFGGVLVTDALDMKAVAELFPDEDVCVKAIKAGMDVALVPTDALSSLNALKMAVNEGVITHERVAESLARLLALKDWCGLFEKRARPVEQISLEENGMLALKTAIQSTRISGDESVLPLEKYKNVAVFALLQGDNIDPASEFFQFFAQVYEGDTDMAFVNSAISDEDIEEYCKGTDQAEIIVFAVFARAEGYKGTVGLSGRLQEFIQKVSRDKVICAVLFGNPYLDETIDADVYIKMFSDSKASRGAACLALSNKSLNIQ